MAGLLNKEKKKSRKVKKLVLLSLTLIVVSACIIIAVAVSACCFMQEVDSNGVVKSGTSEGKLPFDNGAVASDHPYCSEVGVSILKRNGTAIDAAIATVLCLGVVNMHSSGIGGGGVMMVHDPKNEVHKRVSKQKRGFSSSHIIVYDYREVAPEKLESLVNEKNATELVIGGLSIGVPGEVAGMYLAWKNHGKLPWKSLFQPAISLARDGIKVHRRLWEATAFMKKFFSRDPGLSSLLLVNGAAIKQDDILKNPLLADTLEYISENPEGFYTGELAKKVVQDVQGANGVLSLDDLRKYKVKVRNCIPLQISRDNITLHVAPPPFSGLIVGYILRILQGFNFNKKSLQGDAATSLTYHRMAEAMKFGFAMRTLLGDPDFMNSLLLQQIIANITNDNFIEAIRQRIDNTTHEYSYYNLFNEVKNGHGTTHVSVKAPDGTSVSITNSINIWFGSQYRSPITGIIYNNHIDDFSIPNRTNAFHLRPSWENRIRAYKRPLSSMSPSFITQNGDLKLIIGASGGTRIITSVASVIINKLWFNDTLEDAILRARVHHQLSPKAMVAEDTYPLHPKVIQLLKDFFNHSITFTSLPEYSSVQAILLENSKVYAQSDPRKYGRAAGY